MNTKKLQSLKIKLEGKEFLNDEEIDFLTRFYCGIESKHKLAYVPSINVDACLTKWRNKTFKSKEQVIKNMGTLFESRINSFEGVIIIIHGPQAGQTVFDNSNLNNHWSVAYFDKKRNKFFHYDSLNNLNKEKFYEILNFLKYYNILINNQTKVFGPSFIPQQPSSWECGYFTLMYAYILSSHDTRDITPISKEEIIKYQTFFDMNPGSVFRNHILQFTINIPLIDNL